jgi:VIT1/CCC1 family predicted Fe2+/Mn2+ transporter
VVASVLPSSALEALRLKLHEMPEPPARPRLRTDDWRGAAAVFSLVFLSTFPVVLPFIVVPNIRLAARISDVIAIAMLFFAGHSYGRYAGHQAWGWGLSMVIIGGLMVGLTIGLGG